MTSSTGIYTTSSALLHYHSSFRWKLVRTATWYSNSLKIVRNSAERIHFLNPNFQFEEQIPPNLATRQCTTARAILSNSKHQRRRGNSREMETRSVRSRSKWARRKSGWNSAGVTLSSLTRASLPRRGCARCFPTSLTTCSGESGIAGGAWIPESETLECYAVGERAGTEGEAEAEAMNWRRKAVCQSAESASWGLGDGDFSQWRCPYGAIACDTYKR